MIAIIYQFTLKLGKEKQYCKCWREVASYFVKERGALGSSLHKGEDGFWVVYSRWPDEKTRQASWPGDNAPSEVLPKRIRTAIKKMQSYVDDKLPEMRLEIVDDLLLTSKKKK